MEANSPAKSATENEDTTISSSDIDSISQSSDPFVGSWQNVISHSNWEKGRIIFEWREALIQEGVAARLYSDPAWSRLVGEVTAQHVGRLRRTFDRFGETYQEFEGIYWSHFFAALDWDDAEMWLEGAIQNKWSVSKMRYQRWETMGALKEDEPDPNTIVSGQMEEGISQIASSDIGETKHKDEKSSIQGPTGPLHEKPDFGEDDGPVTKLADSGSPSNGMDRVDIDSILEELPVSIADPFRALRESIVEAKSDDWNSAKRIHLVALVNDLRQLLRNEPKKQDVESVLE